MDPPYPGNHYGQYPAYGDYPVQGGERPPARNNHQHPPYGRENRETREPNPSSRNMFPHAGNPSPPDLTPSSSYASLSNNGHPSAPAPSNPASGSSIASAAASTPLNPVPSLQQQQNALNSTAYLVPAAKPFYPAYNSPLLKNVTTFAETRLSKVYTSFVATFAGFSCFPSQAGVGVNSPCVDIEGHQWCVRIYAAGVDENVGGYISVYLVHDSDEPIRAGVRITLVNSRYSSDNHVVSTEGDRYMAGKGASIGWGKFIHTSSVNRYCIDDVMVLRLDVTVFLPPKMILVNVPRSKSLGGEKVTGTGEGASTTTGGSMPGLQDILSRILHKDEGGADVRFLVAKKDANAGQKKAGDSNDLDHEVIYAHSFILSLRSDVFRKLFKSGRKAEGSDYFDICVDDSLITAQAVKEMLRYLYTDQLSSADLLRQSASVPYYPLAGPYPPASLCTALLLLACKYSLPPLLTLCAQHMSVQINSENVCGVLRAAHSGLQTALQASSSTGVTTVMTSHRTPAANQPPPPPSSPSAAPSQAANSSVPAYLQVLSDLRQSAMSYLVKHAAQLVHSQGFFDYLGGDFELQKEVIMALAVEGTATAAGKGSGNGGDAPGRERLDSGTSSLLSGLGGGGGSGAGGGGVGLPNSNPSPIGVLTHQNSGSALGLGGGLGGNTVGGFSSGSGGGYNAFMSYDHQNH
eukprot:gene31662-38264_t